MQLNEEKLKRKELMFSQKQQQVLLDTVIIPAIQGLRKAGQAEYAHEKDDAHANFRRLGELLDMPQEKILWVYLQKHLDGINAHINGYTSQREDVRGRIADAMTYLALLWGMVESLNPTASIIWDDLNANPKAAKEILSKITEVHND